LFKSGAIVVALLPRLRQNLRHSPHSFRTRSKLPKALLNEISKSGVVDTINFELDTKNGKFCKLFSNRRSSTHPSHHEPPQCQIITILAVLPLGEGHFFMRYCGSVPTQLVAHQPWPFGVGINFLLDFQVSLECECFWNGVFCLFCFVDLSGLVIFG
jgi:hypothetical protein